MPTTKSTLFAVSKDEWDTKKGTRKNALYYGKRYLSYWTDVEQWKNQARSLSHSQVMLISQAVS